MIIYIATYVVYYIKSKKLMLVSLWPLFEPIKAIAETILTNDALAPAISPLFYTLFPPLKANSFPKKLPSVAIQFVHDLCLSLIIPFQRNVLYTLF